MNESFHSVPVESGDVIRRHSRSFSLAAKLLPRSIRSDVQRLYAWCRWCDEAVDSAPSTEVARYRLGRLRQDVQRIYRGEGPEHAASRWLDELVQRYPIPVNLPLDLLDGMESDLADPEMQSVDDLLLYCYQAAGTVGLMMCRILGVDQPQALQRARALGIAMQLTNIARDIREDWLRGRRYVPHQWLPVSPGEASRPTREDVRPAVEKLLELAEQHYRLGMDGLRFLPDGARPAIRLAGLVYREIGMEVRRQGCPVMEKRVVVSGRRKLLVAVRCGLGELSHRLGRVSVFRGGGFRHLQLSNFSGESTMNNDGRYLLCLGFSLTLIMAATLFVLVGINPKDPSYTYLPWTYAAVSGVLAAITGWMARRYENAPSALATAGIRKAASPGFQSGQANSALR